MQFAFLPSGNKGLVCEQYRRVEEGIRSQGTSHHPLSRALEQTEQLRKNAGATLHSSRQSRAGGAIIRPK